MEGWQKGAGAVLKMSGAGKENYFRAFPERKEWFQSNFPEHFGRSVAVATTSLKKVTKAKQQKQRLAVIRQVAEKRNQAAVLTPERRLMAQRRREGGEGLAGGMDTVADIRKSIAAGMPIRSGGIGSLFEAQSASVEKRDDGYYVGSQGPFQSKIEAEAILKASQPSSKKDAPLTLPPDRSQNFRTTDKTSVDGTTPPPDEEIDYTQKALDWLEQMKLKGADWPDPGAKGEDKRWGRVLGQVDAKGNEIGWMSQGDQFDILRTPPDDTRIDTRDPSRRPVEKVAREAGYYYPIKEENIEECMPMPGDNKWDYLDTWEKNPIKKGSTSSEADDEPGEYDYEGDMAKSQLRSIMHNSKMLHDLLEDNTNLPEWVQSKITLAEDYILTAANYMRGEMDRMDEEVEQIEEGKGYAPGWMLKKDKDLGAKVKEKIDLANKRQASYGKPKVGISVMPPTDYGLADPVAGGKFNAYMQKRKEQLEAQAEQSVTHDDLVAQHMSLHNKQEGEVMEEGAGAMKKKSKSDDLVKRSMLPDRSVIPAGKGFGDDLKKQKIIKKVGKIIAKKRMARPTDNPSENELVPQSMLPDTPGYPEGYQMEEQVVEQPVEQQVEIPVVEENTNPLVSAGSKFLTRTSARLVYGDKND